MVKSSVKKVAMALSIASVFCGVNVTDNVASAEIHESRYKNKIVLPKSPNDWIAPTQKIINEAIAKTNNPNAQLVPANKDILNVQRRVMEVNGLSYGDFTRVYDYKTKVQPIYYLEGYNNSFATGLGKIITGEKNRFPDTYDMQYYYYLFGHEIGHCVLGHVYIPDDGSDPMMHENKEIEANEYSLDTCAKIGECSWSGFYKELAKPTGPHGEGNSMFERDAVNKYIFEKGNGVLSSKDGNLAYKGLYYEDLFNASQNVKFGNTIVSYAFAQFAFAIDKGVMSTKNVYLEDFNKDSINKSALVFRSPSIQGGYKIIAMFAGKKEDVQEAYNKLVETNNAKFSGYVRAKENGCFMYVLMRLIKDYEENGVNGTPKIY